MKTSFKSLFGLTFAILCLNCKNMTMADETQPSKSGDAFAIRTALSLWKDYFQKHVKKGDKLETVRDVMKSKSLDWGRLNFGGTGNFDLRFKLDDFIQAEFQFDASNTLQSYGVMWRREFWIKDPDGNILYRRSDR